jgi:hypothetical protein
MDWMTQCSSKLKENTKIMIYWKKVCITRIPKSNYGLKYERYNLLILVF